MQAALALDGVLKRFGGLVAVDGVSLAIAPGDRRLLIGPNGAGKTTLFNLITGDLEPSAGSIHVFGREITRLPPHRRAHLGIARTYQILTLFPRSTFVENVVLSLLGLSSARWDPLVPLSRRRALDRRAREILAELGLEALADRPLDETSYGERRRLEIAMALAQAPRLLLLDEPLAGLSREERAEVQRVLNRISRKIAIVMVEHDMETALAFAETVTVLHQGRVLVDGSRTEALADPRVREVYLAA
jgi:branched-chain amino acid transport system ATP-binding protein